MYKNSYPGKFIVFEGLDGSGQSTQANLLKDFLIKKGYQVVLIKEPTLSSEAGRKIRKVLDKKIKISPGKLQQLFSQDRKEHLEKVIIPALKKGKIVISDRYFFSSLAYGAAEGLSLNYLIKLNKKFLLPDLTFILKVRPEICLQRIKKRGTEWTLFEEKEKLKKVWRVYQNLPSQIFKRKLGEGLPKKFGNAYIINGEKSIKEVFREVRKIVYKHITNKHIAK